MKISKVKYSAKKIIITLDWDCRGGGSEYTDCAFLVGSSFDTALKQAHSDLEKYTNHFLEGKEISSEEFQEVSELGLEVLREWLNDYFNENEEVWHAVNYECEC